MICPGRNAVISLAVSKTCLPCLGTTKKDQKDHHLPCMMMVVYLMKMMIMTYTNKISSLTFDENDDYDIQIKFQVVFILLVDYDGVLVYNQHILKVQENRVKKLCFSSSMICLDAIKYSKLK